jgi:RND superfamily putative drug exporter
MFSKLADTIMKHSKAIVALWIVVLIVAVPFALKSNDVLEYDMSEMSGSSTESSEGSEIIDEYFGDTSVDLSDILVIAYNSSSELEDANNVYSTFKELVETEYADSSLEEGTKITVSNYGTYSKTDASTAGVMLIALSNNVGIDFDMVHETGNIRDMVDQAKETVGADLTTYVTGNDAISYDTEESSMDDVKKVDPLSVALIFILLGLFFYALVTAVLPPAVVGMAYGIAMCLLYVLGTFLDIYYITSTLMLVVMLGAGCDYAIFIITRYRDECKKGKSHEDALREAIMWGGESVFTSGISVMIGFAALALCSFSLVQTMGIGLAMGILVALIAALTFVPSLINLAHDKIFWPSNIKKYQETDALLAKGNSRGLYRHLCSFSKRYFSWLSRNTYKHAKAITAVLILVAVPSIYVYENTEDSSDMISIMPDSESVDGLNLIMTQTDGGTIMPTYVVLELNESVATVDSFDYNGTTLNYVIWNDTGPDTSTMTGVVPTIMSISSQIESEYSDIVGSCIGLNSWYVIYYQTALALGTTDAATVNTYIYNNLLPSAVQSGIGTLLTQLSYVSTDSTDWTVTPDTAITALNGLTVANIIDGVLNVSTGVLSSDGAHVDMMIITSEKPMSDNTMDFIDDLRADLHDGDDSWDSLYSSYWSASYVTGTSAVIGDIGDEVEDQFSMIRVVVMILLIFLLFFILGSYLTPIRAILTIILSVIFTVSVTRLVFSDLLDTPVLFLVPVVLFVVLLGLGMDYEIFLTTKIRENKIKGMSNDMAINMALREAGPVISLCALLMGGTFLTLLTANSSMLQEFGFALGVGILIDGLLMVSYVSPALMHLMGNWSWKGPRFLTAKHGINPDGSSATAPSAEESTQALKDFRKQAYAELAAKQKEADDLRAEVKHLEDQDRIGRLDAEGKELLRQKREEYKQAKKEAKAFKKETAKKESDFLGMD